MKRVGVAAAVLLVCGGCKLKPPPDPPASACQVEVSRLVAADPRWAQVRQSDARIAALRARLQAAGPAYAPAVPPTALAAVPEVPAPGERPDPPSLRSMADLGEQTAKKEEARLAQRDRKRAEAVRLDEQDKLNADLRLRAAEAGEAVWRQQYAIYSAYQPQITRLRLMRDRLRESPPLAVGKGFREKELQECVAELKAIEAARDAALDAVQAKSDSAVEKDAESRRLKSAERLREMEEIWRGQREDTLRTTRQNWQDRMDSIRGALQEAPPGPVKGEATEALALSPAAGSDGAAPAGRPVAPAMTPAARKQVLSAISDLQARRQRLAQAVEAEIRARVAGIARRSRMNVSFAPAGDGLPDRTDYFAQELGRTAR